MFGHDAAPEPQTSGQQSFDDKKRHAPRLKAKVRELVSEERFAHIERVVALATAIGEANGFSEHDKRRVTLAALLHDAARDFSDERILELVTPENEVETDHPLVLHGRASRLLAESWGVDDEVVLGAIEGHVFGVPLDDHVGMAVYVADVSEPGREVNDDIRELAMRDLAAAYRRAVSTKVEYLTSEGVPIHPATMRAYESLHEAGDAGETDVDARPGTEAP